MIVRAGVFVTGSVKEAVTLWPAESFTVTEKVTEPLDGGVPLRCPAVVSVNHEGNSVADQL